MESLVDEVRSLPSTHSSRIGRPPHPTSMRQLRHKDSSFYSTAMDTSTGPVTNSKCSYKASRDTIQTNNDDVSDSRQFRHKDSSFCPTAMDTSIGSVSGYKCSHKSPRDHIQKNKGKDTLDEPSERCSRDQVSVFETKSSVKDSLHGNKNTTTSSDFLEPRNFRLHAAGRGNGDHIPRDNVSDSIRHYNKEKEFQGESSLDQVLIFETESLIKDSLCDAKKTTTSSVCLEPRNFTLRAAGREDGDLLSYCPSPQNSFYTARPYIEPKHSFTATEVSGCVSSLDKSSESGDVSTISCDIIESRKTSFYRGSTGSDISDESSSTSCGSAMYKPHQANDTRWDAIQAVRSRDRALGFHHFRLLKRLGGGDIGSVFLAELIGTANVFAIKVMDNAALESRKKTVRAQTEREILRSLDHPFLPTLYSHFETEKFSCLVMEFCPGGDLHALRQRQPGKFFPEHAARFYVAEVLLALEYLHMLGIIYRDLKPENVLVREDGHIMLSDFDLSLRCSSSPTLVKSSNSVLESKISSCIDPSCVIQTACFSPGFLSKPKKGKKSTKLKSETYNQANLLPELIAEPTTARSMSFVGTHEYLAPEIIKGEGHGSAVDWWTFGIFLYELLYGQTPFKGAGNRATLFNVVGQPLKFPSSPSVSFAARDLIRGLLVKEPQHRLAYRRGATEIKQHPFFQSVNWALIRCASPPDVPNLFVLHDVPMAPAATDVKPSDNYFEIDFF